MIRYIWYMFRYKETENCTGVIHMKDICIYEDGKHGFIVLPFASINLRRDVIEKKAGKKRRNYSTENILGWLDQVSFLTINHS